MDFKPVWIEPDAACAANEAIMTDSRSMNRWVPRETAVLQQLTARGAEPVTEQIPKLAREPITDPLQRRAKPDDPLAATGAT